MASITASQEAPRLYYTVSARSKDRSIPIFPYLRKYYPELEISNIESLFGFVEETPLYGGRIFQKRELSERNVRDLNKNGIGVRLPLTNHTVSRAEFERSMPLLDKYHHELNSVITTSDDLALWIKQEFPKYKLDASVIKNINSHDRILRAFEIYDCVVLPMTLSEDWDFLEKVEEKDRIILFANGGCALTCPSKICYPSISIINKGEGGEFRCSQSLKERELLGVIDFDVDRLVSMGFTRFKVLRARKGGKTGA